MKEVEYCIDHRCNLWIDIEEQSYRFKVNKNSKKKVWLSKDQATVVIVEYDSTLPTLAGAVYRFRQWQGYSWEKVHELFLQEHQVEDCIDGLEKMKERLLKSIA